MGQGQKLKIDQVIEWLDRSDYYRILNVPREFSPEELKGAYFKLSRQYHPDKYYSRVDRPMFQKFTSVFKRLNEAYMILKDPQKRRIYDKKAFGPERENNLRYDFGEEDRGGLTNPEDQAETPNGKKYLKLALVAQRKKDWRGAELNLNFALGFEPENEFLKKMMETVKVEINNLPKEDPFKIR